MEWVRFVAEFQKGKEKKRKEKKSTLDGIKNVEFVKVLSQMFIVRSV